MDQDRSDLNPPEGASPEPSQGGTTRQPMETDPSAPPQAPTGVADQGEDRGFGEQPAGSEDGGPGTEFEPTPTEDEDQGPASGGD